MPGAAESAIPGTHVGVIPGADAMLLWGKLERPWVSRGLL